MAVLRSEIGKALDELKFDEGGMKFQDLAVTLAKIRWPELIACERKKDLGLDAHAPAKLSTDGIGKGLASSITATLEKISLDATTIQKHYDDVAILIFATSQKVTKEMEAKWSNEIRKKFGYQLVVMSKQDIITSLMLPSNAPLCRSFGITAPVEADSVELVKKVREITIKLATDRLTLHPLAGKPLVPLRARRLENLAGEAEEVLQLHDLKTMLMHSRRIVLEAPAGRGKTTTLVQLANQYGKEGGIAFLIDLPVWVMSGKDILEYIAQLPHFRSQGVDSNTLAKVSGAEHISFLLNGWNEISDKYSGPALAALQQLERSFPAAGIIVATRTHHLIPPLPGALRAKLLSLNRAQREDYIKRALTSRGDELCSKLDDDPVLDELTRTPLILSKVTEIFAAGRPMPTTKIGVLDAVMGLIEQSTEHCSQLQQPPLRGHAGEYLTELAIRMIDRTEVMIPEQEARPIISSASITLRDAGQITTMPEPHAILNELCAHHVLERQDYPSVTFRFEHQQFQEFFAALRLKNELSVLIRSADKAAIHEFTKKYVNEPTWAEPLKMVAEEIGANGIEATDDADWTKVGKMLVEMALSVDPIFAAELSRLCGALVWSAVNAAVSDCLRSWYRVDDPNHRQCALAGMLASGSADFSDIILPLLTSEDQQVRLRVYDLRDEFHLSTLGPGWQNSVRGWKEKNRIDFVRELTQQRWVPEIVETFVLKDPSIEVRIAGIESLSWVGSQEEVGRLLERIDQATFERALQLMYPEKIPILVRSRALAAYQKCYSESGDALTHLRVLLNAAKLGEADIAEKLKTELERIDRVKLKELGEFVIKPSLDIVKGSDPWWVSNWVAERIIDGSLWHEHWSVFITTISEDVENHWLQRLASEDLKHQWLSGIISVLAAGADRVFAESVFSKLCDVRRKIAATLDERHEYEWAIARQLEDLFRALSPNIGVAGLSNIFEHDLDGTEFAVVVGLFSRVGRSESDLRGELDNDLRQKLCAYLKGGLTFALGQDDFFGGLKADMATALALVGEPEDMVILRKLIRADIERVRKGRAARSRGDRTPLGDGATTSWVNWYLRAVMQLDFSSADEVVLELLQEPEYGSESASALVRLAVGQRSEERIGHRIDYDSIWKAREGQVPSCFEEERRKRYAVAIKERVSNLLEQYRAGETDVSYNLKELAKTLAVLDAAGSAELILEVISLPGEWDGYVRIQALESLLFNGVKLPTKTIISLFDMTMARIRARGHYRDEDTIRLVKNFLCVLPFVVDPSEGLKKISEIITEFKLPIYELRDVVAAIGYSRCNDVLTLLRELAGSNGKGLKEFGDSWINAVAVLDTPESRRVLLSFVDPEIKEVTTEQSVEREEILTLCIADLARRDSGIEKRIRQLCDIPLTSTKRRLLSEVIARIGTPESILAGLNLIDDTAKQPIPYGLLRVVEAAFIERRPYGQSETTFTLAPRSSNAIREKLFEMVTHDEHRKRAAFSFLGKIELWRLEYGRPSGEPRHPALESKEQWPPIVKIKRGEP